MLGARVLRRVRAFGAESLSMREAGSWIAGSLAGQAREPVNRRVRDGDEMRRQQATAQCALKSLRSVLATSFSALFAWPRHQLPASMRATRART